MSVDVDVRVLQGVADHRSGEWFGGLRQQPVGCAVEYGDAAVLRESARVENAVRLGEVVVDQFGEVLAVVVSGVLEDIAGNTVVQSVVVGEVQERDARAPIAVEIVNRTWPE